MSMEFPEPCTGHGGGSDFEPLPKGEYVAQAVEGRVAPPKTGNGMGLTLVWKILEGRQIWQNISFIHPKAGAQWHGQRRLNAFIAAVGATLPLATVEPLLFVPVRLGLDIEDRNDGYGPKNVVTRVARYNGEAEDARAAPAPQPSGPAPAAAAKPAPTNQR